METTFEKQSTCCLQRFNCCIIPFVATFICFGLFALIIVASKLEDSVKDVSWREATLIGNAFRIDSLKVVVPILRRCDGPELEIEFYTSENTKITNLKETVNSCGSSLSNWLSSSPTELSLNYLNAASDDIHAIIMKQDFVHLSIVDSQNMNASEDIPNIFTVCVLPSNSNQKDKIKISPKNIPKIAAFFESWIFYHASEFIFYDHEILQNDSNIFELYSNNTKILFPLMSDQKIIEQKFKDSNLFFIYDCFYRSRFTSHWTVVTTFDSIPMVQTRSSLSNILSTVAISMETENLVYQIFNDKSKEESTTKIFDGRLINGFKDNLEPIFNEETGKVTQIPIELVKTYSLLQLNSELFQQANTSPMNQIYNSWIRQYNEKQNSNLNMTL